MDKVNKAIEILQAFKEGKTIEYKHFNSYNKWNVFDGNDVLLLSILTDYSFRIKPQPTYRPYANAEEFLKASKEHGPWLRLWNKNNDLCLPIMFPNDTNSFWYLWKDIDNNELKWQNANIRLITGEWQDGTPCGILEQ